MARKAEPTKMADQRAKAIPRVRAASVLLGVAALALVGAVLAGRQLPLLAGDREALIALTVIGVALCGSGPSGRIAVTGAWLSWGGIIGITLGALALLVAGTALAGTPLPVVAGDREAFIALAGIMVVKGAFGVLHRLAT